MKIGTIYCSPTTASLVKLKLRVDAKHIVSLELERKYSVVVGGANIEVTLTDANHCPGATCILFRLPNGREVFHTGDFRWNPSLLKTSTVFRQLVSHNCL